MFSIWNLTPNALFFQTFDLKGSMRSRYVQTSGMKNDVLLDENLLECESKRTESILFMGFRGKFTV